MEDYRVFIDTPSNIQRKLNQWRHDYIVKVISVTYAEQGQCICTVKLISRED